MADETGLVTNEDNLIDLSSPGNSDDEDEDEEDEDEDGPTSAASNTQLVTLTPHSHHPNAVSNSMCLSYSQGLINLATLNDLNQPQGDRGAYVLPYPGTWPSDDSPNEGISESPPAWRIPGDGIDIRSWTRGNAQIDEESGRVVALGTNKCEIQVLEFCKLPLEHRLRDSNRLHLDSSV